MRVVVVGAGPVGLFCAISLARRGHDVAVIDRDAGPAADGEWHRRGVMQFMHPHAFRPQVHQALATRMPDVLDEIVAAGAMPVHVDGLPEGVMFIQSRRLTFERGLRSAAVREPRLELQTGHVERITEAAGRVSAVVVDGATIDADAVLCASGRAGRIDGDRRAPADGGSCGFSYVSRMYRARPGTSVPARGIPIGELHDGYLAILFPQDADTVSTLVVRASTDDELAELRHTAAFDAAARVMPNFATYTDPERFEPITPVLPGGGLTNTYRSQLDEAGRVPLPGLLFVGDAVCTTNPAAGRGVSLGLMQAEHVLDLFDQSGDFGEVAQPFDAWCEAQLRPWYDDHVYWDATLLRRFGGGDIDLHARIPSDVIAAAAEVLPEVAPAAGMYQSMIGLPSVLSPFEEQVRDLLRSGWRPRLAEGPSRAEVADVVRRALANSEAAVYPQRQPSERLPAALEARWR